MKLFLQNYFKYFILIIIIYIPVFGFLGVLPIRIWDESRLAMNAYEMLYNGNFIVTYYDGKPDMWNTKPPLLIWLQVLFMKINGVNELSIRLPSAFAALFTCITLLIFSVNYLKKFWFGFITIIILITSTGYVDEHIIRTGDYDALLTFFTTLSSLLFFIYLETKKNKFLYLFFLITALAVLTKSISGLLFLPAIAIYTLWQKQFLLTLRNRHFYIGLFLFLFLALGYYALREKYNPGYIKSVKENDLGGRYFTTLANHKHGYFFYLRNIIRSKLSIWYLIPLGFLVGIKSKDKKKYRITLFSTLIISTYFIIISASQTKLGWYDAPLYPFFSILIAFFIYYIFDLLKNLEWVKYKPINKITPYLFLILVGTIPYFKILQTTYKPEEHSEGKIFYEIGYFLKDAIKGKQDVNDYYLLYDGYNPHNNFYIKTLQDRGVNISSKDWTSLNNGDKVIAHQNDVKQYIEDNYSYKIIKKTGNVINYIIYDKKK